MNIEQVIDWTSSDKGKAKIREFFERAKRTSEKYKKDQQLNWKNLLIPMDI